MDPLRRYRACECPVHRIRCRTAVVLKRGSALLPSLPVSLCTRNIASHCGSVFRCVGKQLIYVAILSLFIIYIYAVASFAVLRVFFDRNDGLFCETLGQCYATSIRHGLLATLGDVSHEHYMTTVSVLNGPFLILNQFIFNWRSHRHAKYTTNTEIQISK